MSNGIIAAIVAVVVAAAAVAFFLFSGDGDDGSTTTIAAAATTADDGDDGAPQTITAAWVPGSSAVGEDVLVPAASASSDELGDLDVASVALVGGSSPGLALIDGGFVCEQPGSWPLAGVATGVGDPTSFTAEWECTESGSTVTVTITIPPPTNPPEDGLVDDILPKSPVVVMMDPSGEQFPVYKLGNKFAIVIPDVGNCTFFGDNGPTVWESGDCEGVQAFASQTTAETAPADVIFTTIDGAGIIAVFDLPQVSVGKYATADIEFPSIGSLLTIPAATLAELPLDLATEFTIEGVPGVWVLAVG